VSEGLLRFAEVSLGSGGLPACTRCSTRGTFEPRQGAEVTAEALAVIESWDCSAYGPGPNLSFVDAEPFLHRELPAIVFAAAEAGASRIRLCTGGEALSVSENAGGVLHAGVRHIEIVLLGGRLEHDRLAGRPGAFEALEHGTRVLGEAAGVRGTHIALTGRVPVCRHNLEDTPSAVAALAGLGASAVVLEVSDEAGMSVDASSWLSSACDTGVVNGTWVSVASARAIPSVHDLHLVPVSSATPRVGLRDTGGEA
jgi:MoaA/NifB/PqqE/SkfB family radical SAM enzyme